MGCRTLKEIKTMCNIEFPHFGASYPDAHCIDGYLWDMDSYENGCYTIGGDDPCPFCNTEAWLKTVLDNEEFASREEALAWVEKMREKWGAEHRGSSEIPNDLEEAADKFANQDCVTFISRKKGFIAGAKWQKEQMLKEAVETWMLEGSMFEPEFFKRKVIVIKED